MELRKFYTSYQSISSLCDEYFEKMTNLREVISHYGSVRYRKLLNELHNAFRIGRNKYPKALTAAYDLEINWRGDTKGAGVTPNAGVAFATES